MTDPRQQTHERPSRAYAGESPEGEPKPPPASWDGGAREPPPIKEPMTAQERLRAAYKEIERYGR